MRISRNIREKIKSKLGVCLDVGCGQNKQPNFLGMDKRKVPGVDILHDAEVSPWPLPDSICNKILCSHIYEHIKPWVSIDFMNECWRVMKPGGQLLISTPYATSHGFYQDPTHCNPANESTWTYFDPAHFLWKIYKPKPWKIIRNAFQMIGNMEIILEKRSLAEIEGVLKSGQLKIKDKKKK
uniref:Putative methyltransferase n=1 Tax=viral metagenome TaxID=1070528 RepID=A0A6M3LK12_9ZZZZ